MQILNLYDSHDNTAKWYFSVRGGHQPQGGEADTYIFPLFSQLTENLKELIGSSDFLRFMNLYLKNPVANQKIKEEMSRLEREVLGIEAKEQEKFESFGIQMPSEGGSAG